MIEQIVVDANGADEQLWSFRQWFEDYATLPFPATIVGANVEVAEVDYDGDGRRGLVARLARDGEEHCVSLLDVRREGPFRMTPPACSRRTSRWSGVDTHEGRH